MTDFRRQRRRYTYSGGTVRESHPVVYSPYRLHSQQGTQILLYFIDIRFICQLYLKKEGKSKAFWARRFPFKNFPVGKIFKSR